MSLLKFKMYAKIIEILQTCRESYRLTRVNQNACLYGHKTNSFCSIVSADKMPESAQEDLLYEEDDDLPPDYLPPMPPRPLPNPPVPKRTPIVPQVTTTYRPPEPRSYDSELNVELEDVVEHEPEEDQPDVNLEESIEYEEEYEEEPQEQGNFRLRTKIFVKKLRIAIERF
jgi:hypothetical protein